MARSLRIEYPGAVYHVFARGRGRREIFRDDEDRRCFLVTLAEAIEGHDLRLHGYCLMPDHYHLLLETPHGNLTRAIGWLQTTYSIRFNVRHEQRGHFFQGRFKAQVVDVDACAKDLLRYVHLNPVRPRKKAAVVAANSRGALADFRWSSHRAYLGRQKPPAWLRTDWLKFFARTRDAAQRRYAEFVAEAFGTIVENPWRRPRFGVALGDKAFLERVKKLLKAKANRPKVPRKPGPPKLTRAEKLELRKKRKAAAKTLVRQEEDLRWRIWIRVRLGREKGIDVGRAYDYADGSAVSQTVNRLERAAQSDRALRKHMAALEKAHEQAVSES